ncbi:MAG: ComEC/Rec2 family competence protein [Chromatiales bacterium]|nr:ComEC/Rec2 family competence protein [Chromatiales bacterium]
MMYFLDSIRRLVIQGEAWLTALFLVAGILVCVLAEQAFWGPAWIGVAAALLALGVRQLRVLAAGFAGFLLASLQVQQHLADRLAEQRDGIKVQVEGQIASLVSKEPGRIRFLFTVDKAGNGIPSTLQLSWYRNPVLPRAGERWRFEAKLRAPRGYLNPNGFDYERWLFRQGIGATGYVRHGELMDASPRGLGGRLLAIRESFREALESGLPDGVARQLVIALVLGEKRGLSQAQREVLAATGTSHLLAISGLHIGLVAGGTFWLVGGLSRLCWPVRSRRVEVVSWSISLLLAGLYACLAGLAIPTRRALLMLCMFAGFRLSRRSLGGWQALCIALGVVCLFDPLAVLDQGLWLSFGAVACIGLVIRGHRSSGTGRWSQWLNVQLAISIGLAPVLVAQYGQISILAPLVNLLLVPWFGVAILPPLLIGVLALALWPDLANPLLLFQASHLGLLWSGLEQLAVVGAWKLAHPGGLVFGLAVLGSGFFLLPPGMPGRRLGLVCWLSLLAPIRAGMEPTEFSVTVLDVGQGLATVLRTRNHLLVYDTGPAYRGNAVASLTLIPYLRAQGVRKIDVLVTSHSDMDHAGGREAVGKALNPAQEFSGDTLPGTEACIAGMQWEWDGVSFRFLHPTSGAGLEGNEASCVLLVRSRRGSVLFTGDIPASVERALLSGQPCLGVDVLIAPHHGSGTSSSAGLVKASSPYLVIFAAGFNNRWGFPLESVVNRWHRVGSKTVVTGQTGAVTVRFTGGEDGEISLERMRNKRIWRAGPVSSGLDVQYDSSSFPIRDVRSQCSKLSDPADG